MAEQKHAPSAVEGTEPEITETGSSTSITGKEPEPEKTKRRRKKKYIFHNAGQCPRCKTHDTVATSTKGKKQYRICQRGHCRYRYCVTGVKEK